MEPVRIGLVGLKHYAGVICQFLETVSHQPDAPVKLTTVCPGPGAPAETVERLRSAGIRLVDRYEDFLNEPTEAVWLPLPIHLHRPFTEQALAAGKAVLCEKPVAGCVDDVDAMIAAERRAGRPVAIGYQHMYSPVTLELKRRLLDGAIGRLQRLITVGAWPRGQTYYQRSNWAGRHRADGQWVMDSIANNAMAHDINYLFFMAGPELYRAAQPVAVEAELYRANPIENFDTASLRLPLDTGAEMLVLQTHGCASTLDPLQEIIGENGRVLRTGSQVVIESRGRTEILRDVPDARFPIIRCFAEAVRGLRAIPATLENSRNQLVAVNGASEATAVVTIPDEFKRPVETETGSCQAVYGIESLFRLCARRGTMLHASGHFEWSRPAGHRDLRGYRHFSGPKLA